MRWLWPIGWVVMLAGPSLGDSLPPIGERIAGDDPAAVSFRRHVVPLLGRLGCNGRACHGSFQGRGGFRLSLFGYDFDADYQALVGARSAAEPKQRRVDRNDPAASLVLEKPISPEEHGGGKRMEAGSWQHRLLQAWIKQGAASDAEETGSLDRLEVTPAQVVFGRPEQSVLLRVVAHWSDGSREDVTALCRFRSNDDSVVRIDESGLAKAARAGDTHLVVFYDNGVATVPALLPVAGEPGTPYPDVPAPTPIDQLVVAKLRQLGIVPSEPCTDAEFLRRVSLDLAGSLPTPAEVESFLADRSTDKRSRKIDELLESPHHAAWWATRLCDFLGNDGTSLDREFSRVQGRQWYAWILRRVRENVGYDKIVRGIVLATGRGNGQTFDAYCAEMSGYSRAEDAEDFARRETMPHYWSRASLRDSKQKSLAFAHAFLGVRLQCAECHKHPFDQWTQQDFEQFSTFFERVVLGTPPADQARYDALLQTVAPTRQVAGGKSQRISLERLVSEGTVVPWREVYVAQPGDRGLVVKGARPAPAGRVITPKLLGGTEVSLAAYQDPREPLVEWMLDPANPYFARVCVNRVWASYFGVGIIEPTDDVNLANPPTNGPLLDHLASQFASRGYDMRWLHREITSSRTYQLSCKPNRTNRMDERNFSRAMVRRLPAEVVFDAILQATSAPAEIDTLRRDIGRRTIGTGDGQPNSPKGGGADYALAVFGKPARIATCDCERSNDPSLLQSLFLLNDSQMLSMIGRADGWIAEVAGVLGESLRATTFKAGKSADASPTVANVKLPAGQPPSGAREKLERRIAEFEAQGKTTEAATLRRVVAAMAKNQAAVPPQGAGAPPIRGLTPPGSPAASSNRATDAPGSPAAASHPGVDTPGLPAARSASAGSPGPEALVREAYLRTVSRPPTSDETQRARQHLAESPGTAEGLRELLWALLNSDEFLVNH